MKFHRYSIGNEESVWLCDDCDIPDDAEWLETSNNPWGVIECDACGICDEDEEEAA